MVASVVQNVAALIFSTAGLISYLYVAGRAERPAQLHVSGLLIIVNSVEHSAWVSSGQFFSNEKFVLGFAASTLALIPFFFKRVISYELVIHKVTAARQPRGRCASVASWGMAAIAASCLTAVCRGAIYILQASLIDREVLLPFEISLLDEEGDPRLSQSENTALLVLWILVYVGSFSNLLFDAGLMAVATKQTREILQKLLTRRVDCEALARLLSILKLQVAGVILGLCTQSLPFPLAKLTRILVADEVMEQDTKTIVDTSFRVFDIVTDVLSNLLISGIGVLMFREDPQAGDVRGSIRSLLQSAVLTSRADVVFEGKVTVTPTKRCIVSFPGRFYDLWNALTWGCEEGDLSSACVFLPTSDPQQRFGQHAADPEQPNVCWCTSLYGEVKPWGCRWFEAWKANVERAVGLGLELVVVFFPGEVGIGVVEWDDLPQANLWDGIGLGGSQKGEVAFLRRQGYAYVAEDVQVSKRAITSC